LCRNRPARKITALAKDTAYRPTPDVDPLDYAMPGVRWFQYDDMRHYVRECADQLGLRDWTCGYAVEPPEEIDSALALAGAINRVASRMHFEIWLPPSWFARAGDTAPVEERREARATVTHELLHVKFVAIDRFIDNLYTNLGEQSHGLLKTFYVDAMEQFIDDLAYVVAEALPMPNIPSEYVDPFPKKKRVVDKTRHLSRDEI